MDHRDSKNPKGNSIHESRRGGIHTELRMGRPACQDNWRAEEELVVPEFLMKAADGSRNVE